MTITLAPVGGLQNCAFTKEASCIFSPSLPFNKLFHVLTCVLRRISPVVSEAVMGSEVTSACIVIRLTVYGVDGNSPWIRDAVLEPSSVTLDVSVPSEEL